MNQAVYSGTALLDQHADMLFSCSFHIGLIFVDRERNLGPNFLAVSSHDSI